LQTTTEHRLNVNIASKTTPPHRRSTLRSQKLVAATFCEQEKKGIFQQGVSLNTTRRRNHTPKKLLKTLSFSILLTVKIRTYFPTPKYSRKNSTCSSQG